MPSSRRPYRALLHRDFRVFTLSLFVSLVGTQMQNVAIDWHLWVLTRSPLALGAVGLVRVVPIVFFSLWGGIVADRRDRRKVMRATQLAMAATAAVLAVMTATGRESVAAIYVLTALTSAANAFDGPARHSLVPRLVPGEDLPGALAVHLTGFQSAAILGPALSGLLIAGTSATSHRGLAAVYALNAVSFLGVVIALSTMKASGAVTATEVPESPRRALAEGLRFVFKTPIIVWTMALDFFATFFSGSMSLLPIYADRILHVGATGYGWLRAAPALGAVVASLATTVRPLPDRAGRAFLLSIGAYGAATVAFGLSRALPLTMLALAVTGFADMVSTVVRQTSRQLVTPDALRGRMTSVNMIFFMGGPQLGELEAGVVASLFASVAVGATVAVVSGGAATVLLAGAAALASREVRGYRLSARPAG